jgi:transposase InsO family protein
MKNWLLIVIFIFFLGSCESVGRYQRLKNLLNTEPIFIESTTHFYLWSFDNGTQLRQGLEQWLQLYNQERSHQAFDNLTPDEVYYGLPHPFAEAA